MHKSYNFNEVSISPLAACGFGLLFGVELQYCVEKE